MLWPKHLKHSIINKKNNSPLGWMKGSLLGHLENFNQLELLRNCNQEILKALYISLF